MSSSFLVLVAAVALWLLGPSGAACAEEDAFDPGLTIRAVVGEFERGHISRRPLDDEMSRRWLRGFLDRLDPNRMYFLESDLQDFRRFEDRLDDLAKEGDFGFARLVLKRYRKRVDEAVSYAEEFLGATHDYTIDEQVPVRFDAYAANPTELLERWRLRLKAELMIERLHGRERSEVEGQLSGRYERISRQAREMTDERLCQIYLHSLASIYDPHSVYLSPTFMLSFNQTVSFETYDLKLGLWLRDSAAQGWPFGWQLIAIRRLDGTILDVVEMHPEDLNAMIWFPFGPLEDDTEVILELLNRLTYERLSMSWPRFPSR